MEKPATLLKVTLLISVFHVYQIVKMIPNGTKHHNSLLASNVQ